jgi:hypothetical protein
MPRLVGVVAQELDCHRSIRVANDAISPASHFVTKGAKLGEPTAEDWSFEHNPPRGSLSIGAWPRVFDYEPAIRETNF